MAHRAANILANSWPVAYQAFMGEQGDKVSRGAKSSQYENDRRPHVALLIESSRSYGRLLLSGINRYLQSHPRWLIHFEPGNGDIVRGFERWSGDGVIVRCRSQEVADAIGKRNIPKIMFGPYLPRRQRSAHLRRDLGSNHFAEGVMAAEHLRQCGLRNFAFYVTEYRSPSERERGFVETIRAMGFECAVYRDSRRVGQSDQDAVVNEQALAP